MPDKPSIAWWAQRIGDRTSRGIALETAALIRSGALPVGTQLPPVRELAEALGVSPATVSGAWGELRRYKAISGQGRKGTWVSADNVSPHPQRFEVATALGEHIVADLSIAQPDSRLLPDLSRALAEGLRVPKLNEYDRLPITDTLRRAAQAHWPYRAEAMLAANGGYEALLLAFQALIQPGAVAAVEEPTATRMLDILEFVGAQVVPIPCDQEGPDPDALRHALKRKPAAFIHQPRTHAITGIMLSPARRNALAKVLENSNTLIIEDDGLGAISAGPAASLGERFPERTVHIVSYSKSLGPDLRVAVLSGPREIVDRIQAVRNFGARWTSRVLQGATAWMLGDAEVAATVARARKIYDERRGNMIAALRERGVGTHSRDGLNLWVPVESEQFALLTLTARGIAVGPGSRFCVNKRQDHIRIGISRLDRNVDAIADAVALAARLR